MQCRLWESNKQLAFVAAQRFVIGRFLVLLALAGGDGFDDDEGWLDG